MKATKPLPQAYPKNIKTLGDQLRKKRLDLGLLQKDVAEVIGVDATTIYNWEKGRVVPARRYVKEIIRFLDQLRSCSASRGGSQFPSGCDSSSSVQDASPIGCRCALRLLSMQTDSRLPASLRRTLIDITPAYRQTGLRSTVVSAP
ncbi:MAG: helix-turn-helix domain-containing protein [Candidatus Tectomicrobia bacterium]|nr:helix-turn-helix domain-containing protein [Candidatus Tectomicrobia bacterium]